MSATGDRRRRTAPFAAAAVAMAAAAAPAIADHTRHRSEPIAGVPVQRVVVRNANGAPTAVRATATLPASPPAAGRRRGAPAGADRPAAASLTSTASTVAAATARTMRRSGGVTTARLRGTTGVAPASAYTSNGPLRIGVLRLPTGATLRWIHSGARGAAFTIAGASRRGPGLGVSSRAARGSVRAAAGTYRDVAVRTTGRWTLLVTPRR